MGRRVVWGCALALAVAVNASAQSGPSGTSTEANQSGSQPGSMSVDSSGDAAGDDDVLRRHWVVVCADRGGAARREVVR